jgi:hypothetical protein
MKQRFRYFLFILLLPFSQLKALPFGDDTPGTDIRTVLFYPADQQASHVLDFPVLYLKGEKFMRMEFDELGNQYQNHNFKLIHCNRDWEQSILNDFEFLEGYNEFFVENYELSLNTRTAYTHYTIDVPKVKVSGNYVLMVYRNQNQSDVAITRRFVVYDNPVSVKLDPKFPLDPAWRNTGQQIDFSILYGEYPIYNPIQTVSVVLRQNGRWDNARLDLKPMFIRDDEKLLDYHFYNNENLFPGINEYRGIDIRSYRFNGQNIAGTRFDNQKVEAWVHPETARKQSAALTQWVDANGRFVIENLETRRGAVEADYVETHFSFEPGYEVDGDIYLFGQFSDWKLLPDFRLEKVSDKNRYEANLKLKQGFYNYAYVLAKPGMKPDETAYEGSYNQTENIYDVLVYFRPIGARFDHVIGYGLIDYNKLR